MNIALILLLFLAHLGDGLAAARVNFVGHTTAFIPGTRASKYVTGKKVLYMSQSESELIDRLTREYAKILGMK